MAVYCTERNEFVPYLTCMDCKGCKKEYETKKEKMLVSLTDLVDKLSLSERNHTKEELQSSKYAKAYNGLREKINEISTAIIWETVCEVGYKIDDLTEAELDPIQKIFSEIGRYAGIMLFRHKDVGLFELTLDHSAQLIQSKLGDIWLLRQHAKEKE